jgi:rhodanese-related sulfurtransferase
MKKLLQIIILILLQTVASHLRAYTDISPADLHTRLVNQDTLLLLDVREVSEYGRGHIAEPSGQLTLTPANMPWNSGVLSEEYARLPQNVDIVVYCGSGARSPAASAFLESKGFSRIYNMTGGFLLWRYEHRNGGFGDHTGVWVMMSDVHPAVITCISNNDTSELFFPPGALPGGDSVYVELHFASFSSPNPPDVPESDLDGLFRITALDRFGLSRFIGDSLVLSDTVSIDLVPGNVSDNNLSETNHNFSFYIPGRGWHSASHGFDGLTFHRSETTLRKWYNVEGFLSSAVRDHPQTPPADVRPFPNPFNSSIQISAPVGSAVSIYDLRGRLVEELHSNRWIPEKTVGSGIYIIAIRHADKSVIKKIIYLK